MGRVWINGNPYTTEEGKIVVYTDGACRNNGYYGAKAGIGVWFGSRHPLNVSEPLDPDLRCTNQVAELEAARVAADIASDEGIRNLKLITDSRYVMGCLTEWRYKWKRNGWINARGRPVENQGLIKEICNLSDNYINLTVEHVRGHRDNFGNNMADQLASNGAEMY